MWKARATRAEHLRRADMIDDTMAAVGGAQSKKGARHIGELVDKIRRLAGLGGR